MLYTENNSSPKSHCSAQICRDTGSNSDTETRLASGNETETGSGFDRGSGSERETGSC